MGKYFLVQQPSSCYDHIISSLETGIWPLQAGLDLLIDDAQKKGPVTIIVRDTGGSMVHGIAHLSDVQTSKCLTLFSKLPIQISKRWKGIEARGACKVNWEIFAEISIEKLKILKLRLINQNECTFLKCPPNIELSDSCGLQLVEAIKKTNKSSNVPNKNSVNSVLFFNPVGYRALIINSEKKKEFKINNKTSNKSRLNLASKSRLRFNR